MQLPGRDVAKLLVRTDTVIGATRSLYRTHVRSTCFRRFLTARRRTVFHNHRRIAEGRVSRMMASSFVPKATRFGELALLRHPGDSTRVRRALLNVGRLATRGTGEEKAHVVRRFT